jgi:hypothetical protein
MEGLIDAWFAGLNSAIVLGTYGEVLKVGLRDFSIAWDYSDRL